MKHFAIVAVVLFVAFLIWYEGGSDDSGDGDSTDTNQTGVAAIASALASFENVDPSHNNPGGICGGYDSDGNCTGPATYSSYSDGLAAEEALIQSKLNKYPNWSVSQFIANWSGGTGTVLQNYINKVATALGLDPSEPISDAIK